MEIPQLYFSMDPMVDVWLMSTHYTVLKGLMVVIDYCLLFQMACGLTETKVCHFLPVKGNYLIIPMSGYVSPFLTQWYVAILSLAFLSGVMKRVVLVWSF